MKKQSCEEVLMVSAESLQKLAKETCSYEHVDSKSCYDKLPTLPSDPQQPVLKLTDM